MPKQPEKSEKSGKSGKSEPLEQPEFLLLGEILRPHGIRGELRMRVLTDYPERIAKLGQVHLGRSARGTATIYTVEHLRMHKQYGLLKLTGFDDRDEADKLRGLYVMVRVEDAVPLDEGEYYLYQLIGLAVSTTDGQDLGTIKDVLETGANDVYILDSPTYGEVLIPATEETIIEMNIDAGTMTVKLPDGLLPAD
jgi:16S rRNA processing protein RimM